ncbi:MAG: hypothetical protein ACOYON_02060 [Fimbriimonas sp.]
MKNKTIFKTSISAALALCAMALSSSVLAQRVVPPPFAFSPQRPRLVILLHGVTARPEQDPEIGINTPKHARHYWGIEEIQGLTGRPSEESNRIITPSIFGNLNYKQSPKANWFAPNYVGPTGGQLAPVVFPIGWLTGNLSLQNQTQIKGYIDAMTKSAALPMTHVMVTYRDGSKHLMPQTADAIDQIYRTYQAVYGHIAPANQPQIYLVGHSFGGVVARTILANPVGGDLWGNKLSPTQREQANFIRNRTVFVATLSTPHTGTLISDPAQDIDAWIKQNSNFIEKAVASIDQFTANSIFAALGLSTNISANIREGIKAALDAVAGDRDCLQDLTRMQEYNLGILYGTAQRQDNSKVPIYTMSGRTPGGMYMDRDRSPDIIGTTQTYDILDLFTGGKFSVGDTYHGKRGAFEAAALYATESVLHLQGYGAEGKKPWGTSKYPWTDRVKSPLEGWGPLQARPFSAPINLLDGNFIGGLASLLYTSEPYRLGQDGENDNDGFLGIESGHAMGLNGPFYRVIDPTQWGSWLPWEQDNHGSMMFNPGTGSWIYNELLEQAGPIFDASERISKYAAVPVPAKPVHTIRVELLRVVENIPGTFDRYGKPDFKAVVRVEDNETPYNGPDDTQVWNLAGDIRRTTPSSVIPVRISVIDRDSNGRYDKCIATPVPLRDCLYVYFDTRTQKIYGDVLGEAGDIIEVPNKDKGKGVGIRFRITGN